MNSPSQFSSFFHASSTANTPGQSCPVVVLYILKHLGHHARAMTDFTGSPEARVIRPTRADPCFRCGLKRLFPACVRPIFDGYVE